MVIIRIGLVLLVLLGSFTVLMAQALPTPAPVQLNPPTALPANGSEPNNVPTTPTATATLGVAILEALPDAGDVNVRSEADPSASILGTIRTGTQYVVTGKYYLWYQVRFDARPNGIGYVFGDLVQISGDPSLIPDLSVQPVATVDESVSGATQTWEAITLTPGIQLTATANAGVLQGPQPAGGIGVVVLENNPDATADLNEPRAILPTFTYPAQVERLSTQTLLIPASPTPAVSPLNAIESNGLPPIIPILVLGGFGLLGLVISSLRR